MGFEMAPSWRSGVPAPGTSSYHRTTDRPPGPSMVDVAVLRVDDSGRRQTTDGLIVERTRLIVGIRRRNAQVDEVRALGVVHFNAPVEAARELRVDEQLELSMAGSAGQARGYEQRLPLEWSACAIQLGHRCRDRGSPRVAR